MAKPPAETADPPSPPPYSGPYPGVYTDATTSPAVSSPPLPRLAPLPGSHLGAIVIYTLPARGTDLVTGGAADDLHLANSNNYEVAAIVSRVLDDGLVNLRLFVDGLTEHRAVSVRHGWTWGTWHSPIEGSKLDTQPLSESEIATMRAGFVADGASGEYLVSLCDRASSGEVSAIDTLRAYRATSAHERDPRRRSDTIRDTAAMREAMAGRDAAVARGDSAAIARADIAVRDATAARDATLARGDAPTARETVAARETGAARDAERDAADARDLAAAAAKPSGRRDR